MRRIPKLFLPRSDDVLGMLREQASITHQGMEALAAWAAGDEESGNEVRALEHVADDKKHDLAHALVDAFSTPIDSEDIFSLSRDLDWILDLAKDTVREAELLHCDPDEDAREMAQLLADGVGHLVAALVQLHGPEATAHATEARKCARDLERVYRHGVGHALAEKDVRVMISRRELYRQLGRIAEYVINVAERVWYVTIKEA